VDARGDGSSAEALPVQGQLHADHGRSRQQPVEGKKEKEKRKSLICGNVILVATKSIRERGKKKEE
jgi:hypothetical protein